MLNLTSIDIILQPRIWVALGGLALAAWALVQLRSRTVRVLTVIDGDTFFVCDARGRKFKVRVRGIDCPEIGQPFAQEAKEFAQQWVQTYCGSQWVSVRVHGKDRYGRVLASFRLKHADFACDMVSAGLAWPTSAALSLRWRLALARLSRRGIWSQLFVRKPWEASSRRAGPLMRYLRYRLARKRR